MFVLNEFHCITLLAVSISESWNITWINYVAVHYHMKTSTKITKHILWLARIMGKKILTVQLITSMISSKADFLFSPGFGGLKGSFFTSFLGSSFSHLLAFFFGFSASAGFFMARGFSELFKSTISNLYTLT